MCFKSGAFTKVSILTLFLILLLIKSLPWHIDTHERIFAFCLVTINLYSTRTRYYVMGFVLETRKELLIIIGKMMKDHNLSNPPRINGTSRLVWSFHNNPNLHFIKINPRMVNDKSFFAREYASLGKKPCTSLETDFRRKMAVASMPKDSANSDLKWGALRRNLR